VGAVDNPARLKSKPMKCGAGEELNMEQRLWKELDWTFNRKLCLVNDNIAEGRINVDLKRKTMSFIKQVMEDVFEINTYAVLKRQG